MLKVQEYLLSGKTLDNLHDELAIEIRLHETLPLVILNYNQIDSPKTHPIIKECRGLVLEVNTWNIVAKAFDRFFNLGEDLENSQHFDWSDFVSTSKEDGSIILVYNYKGQWIINSRGSFGNTECGQSGKTWDQFIRPMLEDKFEAMEKDITYVFEFVSKWNKVVRRYPIPQLYLLARFKGEYEIPMTINILSYWSMILGTNVPIVYPFKSLKEIEDFLTMLEKDDPTNEGVVVRDKNGMRLKIKNKAYLALHRLYSNEAPTAKNLLPFVLSGEADELLTYFPEYEIEYREVEKKTNEALMVLIDVWKQNWQMDDQKEFALAIKDKTKFTGILFQIRKAHGKDQTLDILKSEWRNSVTAILKYLFGY